MIHFIVWIVVSAIAGFVASKIINKSGSGLLMDIVLGIVGGFVGGFIVSHIPGLSGLGGGGMGGFIVSHIPGLSGLGGGGGMGGFIVEILVAIGGAMLVIWLYDMVFRRKA